jgi:hypothetical protein
VGGVAAAEESVSLVDSGDDGVVVWMGNTAEATASWLAETAEGEDSVGVMLWVAKATSTSRHGWQRQRWHCLVGSGDSVGIALWVAEMTSALRRGLWRQRWRCIMGSGDSIGIASWVANTAEAMAL